MKNVGAILAGVAIGGLLLAPAVLKSGAKVEASYNEQGGRKIVTSIQVTPGS